MECNGFNSDNYRYFYLDKSKAWSGFTSFTYGELLETDIIKISREDLSKKLFNSNYWNRIIPNTYDHSIVEHIMNEPFGLYKYISMQNHITFKWNGVISFCYEVGEYAIINERLERKMSSNGSLSTFSKETIMKKTYLIINESSIIYLLKSFYTLFSSKFTLTTIKIKKII